MKQEREGRKGKKKGGRDREQGKRRGREGKATTEQTNQPEHSVNLFKLVKTQSLSKQAFTLHVFVQNFTNDSNSNVYLLNCYTSHT